MSTRLGSRSATTRTTVSPGDPGMARGTAAAPAPSTICTSGRSPSMALATLASVPRWPDRYTDPGRRTGRRRMSSVSSSWSRARRRAVCTNSWPSAALAMGMSTRHLRCSSSSSSSSSPVSSATMRSCSCRGYTNDRSGVVMNVVTRAMITSMANSVGGMTPRSSPMLRMISSVRPRVFIRIPTANDSRHLRPTALAAAVDPPHLPSTATNRIRPQNSHSLGSPPMSPMRVRRPV